MGQDGCCRGLEEHEATVLRHTDHGVLGGTPSNWVPCVHKVWDLVRLGKGVLSTEPAKACGHIYV